MNANDQWFIDAIRAAYGPDASDQAWEEWREIAKSFPTGKVEESK